MSWELGAPTAWSAQPPPPPREVVEGFLRPGRVTLLVGPEGSAKSLVALAMAVAVIRGEPWLGRSVERGRVLIVDEENGVDDTLERAYGLGVRPDDAPQLWHYGPRGMQLANRERAAAVERVIATLRPRLVIVDGGVSAGGVADANDNSQVARLFTETLIPWAQRYDHATLLLHHPPKGAHDDDAALGAGAWRRLATAHFAQRAAEPPYESEPTPDGGVIERYRYRLRSTSKVRWGPGDGWEQRLVVVSERDAEGALRWLRVEPDGGLILKRQPASSGPSAADRLVTALRAGGPYSRAELAEAVGMSAGGGGFKSAVAQLLRNGLAVERDGQITAAGGSS